MGGTDDMTDDVDTGVESHHHESLDIEHLGARQHRRHPEPEAPPPSLTGRSFVLGVVAGVAISVVFDFAVVAATGRVGTTMAILLWSVSLYAAQRIARARGGGQRLAIIVVTFGFILVAGVAAGIAECALEIGVCYLS